MGPIAFSTPRGDASAPPGRDSAVYANPSGFGMVWVMVILGAVRDGVL